ncbi:MAG: CarD family transcriptional regulator [Eubacteriales bacterium]|nr:CarD family transcriptional regulator [Eubacteriales bacterium]
MYQKGDYIVYGASGTCKVEDVTRLSIPGTDGKRKYYVLRPVNSSKSTIYSPVNNEKVRIRDVISASEMEEALQKIAELQAVVIENEKLREETYKEILRNADFRQCVSLAYILFQKRKERLDQGRKFTAVDERYLHEVIGVLCTEVSVVLQMDKASAQGLLERSLKQALVHT